MRINRAKFAAAMALTDLNGKQLAEKSGLSRVTITSVKSGKSCSVNTAQKLISVLGPDIIEEVTT